MCNAITAKASYSEYQNVVELISETLKRSESKLTILWLADAETLALLGGLYLLADDIRQISKDKFLRKYSKKKEIRCIFTAQRIYAIFLNAGDFDEAINALKHAKNLQRFRPEQFQFMNAVAQKDMSLLVGLNKTSLDMNFMKMVNNRSIAILGPASGAFASDEINHKFDLAVRVMFRGFERLTEEERKCKVDISYYSVGAADVMAEYNDLHFLEEIKMLVFKRFSYPFQDMLAKKGQARVKMGSTEDIMFQGLGTMAQEMLLDMFHFAPTRIKLFNFNLFLSSSASARYRKGYYLENFIGQKDARMLWSYAIHNIISNYELISLWYGMGYFEADEGLTGVLSLGIREYLNRMESITMLG